MSSGQPGELQTRRLIGRYLRNVNRVEAENRIASHATRGSLMVLGGLVLVVLGVLSTMSAQTDTALMGLFLIVIGGAVVTSGAHALLIAGVARGVQLGYQSLEEE